MFCKNCGEQLNKHVRFCQNCGIEVLSISKNHKDQKNFLKILGYIILTIFIVGIVSIKVFTMFHSVGEKSSDYTFFEHLNQSIEPLGYFDDPVLFDSESINTDDWFSHLIYYDNANNDNVNNLSGSVVKVICEDTHNIVIGSGVNFTEDGLVLTNRHVVDGFTGDNCIVGFPDPASGLIVEVYWARPIIDDNYDSEYDLALMSIEEPVFDKDNYVFGYYDRFRNSSFPTFNPPDNCADTSTNLGDEIFIWGYPPLSGGALTVTNGVISSFYSSNGYLVTSAKILSGNSGGLAVDRYGCYIGVPTAVYTEKDSEYIGEIIDAEFIVDFIENAIADELNEYNKNLDS
ncbi:trypsin-like peptidase domain-containing protein [Patescibacteria group bacterium]|nr:trypsin-like peptidase domain-containing protein [Patescibacteria group bacterium]